MIDKAYKDWFIGLKSKIRSAQLKAAVAVNTELITLYWDLGKMITEKENLWGSKLIEQISKNLKEEFPDLKGLSTSNLKYCKRFYQFYQHPIWQQLVAQIPWGHSILIFSKSKDLSEARFYIQETIANGWSREILGSQLKSDLYARQGKAIHNFKNTLPEVTSDLAHQLIKDPYNFDFLTLTEHYKERELENALVENITKFLLELGSGFAYVGKQVPMQIGDQEYFIDLLFYHLKLRAYVVIELKATDFIPE
jgi:predicted nuclease of restriction endonuclease-like (RecB) superfamily